MKTFIIILAATFVVAGTVAAQNKPSKTQLYHVGAGKQLFIDRAFFDKAENINIRLHPARKTGEKVVEREHPWEAVTLNWFTVIEDAGVVDKGAKYRLWYECYDIDGWPNADDTSFCYAESRDGINWTKPELGLFEFKGCKKNNILFRQIGDGAAKSRVHGSNVFIDPTAEPEARYKAVSQGMWKGKTPPHTLAGMFSADGLKWTRYPRPICNIFADSQYSGFWDSQLEKYVLYGRTFKRGRALGRSTSSDLKNFSPLKTVLYPDDNDPPKSDYYNSAAIKYNGASNVYFMFPSLFQHDPSTLDIRLAVSRDGVKWTWPQQDVAFIPLGKDGAFDSKSLYMGQGMLDVGDETYLYYSGSPLPHDGPKLDDLVKCKQPRAYSRVTVRRDRFVSADAGPEGGWFVTPPLTFHGDTLVLNAHVRDGGSIRVALMDENGKPLPGRGLDDCRPITGDHLIVPVKWKTGGDVALRAGIPTRMKVELKNAALFAFQFTTGDVAK
ncbi:MAG: hypothetical protein U9N87_14900 [Planctomycetota bacterium]|nr:hypothetical protein [Planctomycetota bacterium]